MSGRECHALAASPKETAKTVVLKSLGVERVARWCGVGEASVYQWLSRGTDEEPLPPKYVPRIVAGARSEGFSVDPVSLWPAASSLTARVPSVPEDVQ